MTPGTAMPGTATDAADKGATAPGTATPGTAAATGATSPGTAAPGGATPGSAAADAAAPETVAPWSVTMPGSTVRLDMEPADAHRHGELIHDWMNRPHVVPWWQMAWPLDDIRGYLAGLTHLRPWIVSADGTPFGYVETYRAPADPLAAYYPARATDVGWHLLTGPEGFLGTGIPKLLGRAFVASLLGHVDGQPHRGDRVVCEPDIRNTRMHAFCRRLGFHPVAEIDLPDKRALLMVCAREQFTAAWPDDTAAVATQRGAE